VARHCEAPAGAVAISTRRLLRCARNDPFGALGKMPRVVISGQAARRFTGGATELEVEANNFRRMVLELDRPLPRPRPPDRGEHGGGDRRRNLPGRLPRPAQPRQRNLPDPQNRRRLTGDANSWRDHSSGTPSLRRPAKYTFSYSARILGGPQYPVTLISASVETQRLPLNR